LLLATAILLLSLAIVYGLARGALSLVRLGASKLQGPARMSRHWVRDRPVVALFEQRFPKAFRFISARLRTKQFDELPLTLLVLFALYLVALFGGLVEELHEAQGLVRLDNAVDRWFDAHRVQPFIDAMKWLTLWGEGPTTTIVGLVASLLWWSPARPSGHSVLDLRTWGAGHHLERKIHHRAPPASQLGPDRGAYSSIPQRSRDGRHLRLWLHRLQRLADHPDQTASAL